MMKIKGFKLDISKAESTIIIAVGTAVAVSVFSLVSTKALLGQASYNRRVLHERLSAVKQLKDNEKSLNNLTQQYQALTSNTTNIIGGNNNADKTAAPPNGNNTKIILDALPINYDYPALVSSLTKILSDDGIASPSIGGSDQQLQQNTAASPKPVVVPVSLTLGGRANYNQVVALAKDLERSIRPFDVVSLQLSGSGASLGFSMNVNTYYQPAKNLNYTIKVVR